MVRPPCLTWLHVSDLHFGHGDAHHRFDQRGVTNAIIQTARQMANRLGPPHFVLATGDVAFSGQREQYTQAKEWFLRLQEAVGGSPRLFLVPGNHDVDRRLAAKTSAAALHKDLRQEPRKLDELLRDPEEMLTLWPKQREFAAFARDLGSPVLSPERPFFHEELKSPLGGKLVVVGLNSALLCLDDQDSNKNLMLGNGQLVRAIGEQPDDALLLVLQNHPQEWLLDGQELVAVLQQRAHIQFSGHVHQQQGIVHVPVLGGSRLQFVAGAGHKDQKEEGRHAYAWGQLTPEGLAYYSWVWQPEFQAFALATMIDGFDFKRDDHAFIERVRLPKRVQRWLPEVSPPSPHPTMPPPINIPIVESGSEVRPPSAAPPGASFSPDNASFYIPYAAKGSQLIGRDEALSNLHRQLQERGKYLGRVALSGIGGLGKTQLAAEYCHRHRADYSGGVYWLDAAQDLDGELIALCDKARWLHPDSKHAEKLSVAKQRLLSHGSALLVFDNVENVEALRPYLPAPAVGARVLILSRMEVPGWQSLPLPPLPHSDALALLQAEAGRVLETPEERAAALAIAEQLDGLPLALELVGAYLMRRSVVTWTDCAADLRRRGTAARSLNWDGFNDISLTRHGADLHAALSLDAGFFADNPLLRAAIDVLAWAGVGSMGEDLLRDLLGQPEAGDLIDALALSVQLRIRGQAQTLNAA